MRTTPLVGTKIWFGPKRLGWGWAPVSWEGWLLTLGLGPLAAVFAKRSKWPAAALVAGYLGVVILKGTAPGGPKERAALGDRGRALAE